jgi:hypothetical protein
MLANKIRKKRGGVENSKTLIHTGFSSSRGALCALDERKLMVSTKKMKHKKKKTAVTESPKEQVLRFPRLAEDYPAEAMALGMKLSGREMKKARAKLEGNAFRLLGNREKVQIEVGRIFNRLKKTVDHGKWEKYFEKIFGEPYEIDMRTAQNWMRKAREADIDLENARRALSHRAQDPHAVKMRKVTAHAEKEVGQKPSKVVPVSVRFTVAFAGTEQQRDKARDVLRSPLRARVNHEFLKMIERLHPEVGNVTKEATSEKAAA